jgi:hypothetical protein
MCRARIGRGSGSAPPRPPGAVASGIMPAPEEGRSMKEYRKVAGNTRSAMPDFLLGEGPGRQRYTMVDVYCENPDCEGQELTVHLYPERDPARPLTFNFNFADGCLSYDQDFDKDQEAVAVEFIQDDGRKRLLQRRRQIVRGLGLLALRSRRDYDPGAAYGFQDFAVQRDRFDIAFDYQGRSWTAVDQYCVNPDCPCLEAHLQFFEIHKDRAVQDVLFSALLQLDSGTVRDIASETPVADPAAIVKALQDELGDWHGELSLRRDLLRRIARKRLRFDAADAVPGPFEKAEAPGPPAAPVVSRPSLPGRNDPCPCGSGKKFKRCCGFKA